MLLLVLLVYLPAWNCGFIWDDDDYITENKSLRAADGLWRIWTDPSATPQYYPLVHTTFWLEYHLWGLDPAGYHGLNVVLHALATLLLWRVLATLSVPGAWWIAAIWGVHPVQVETVAWATERKNVLSADFYLLALLTALPLAGLPDASTRSHRLFQRAVTMLLFICALLSKSVTCSLPAVIWLLIYWKRGRLRREDLTMWVPFLIVGALFAWNTARLEKSHVGASAELLPWTFAERCLIAGRSLWFYASTLVWPIGLNFNYPRWVPDTQSLGQWGFLIAAVLVPMALWAFRKRLGRGPLVAVLYFGGTLLPALGFINVYPMRYSFVADHFQYLASIGIITVLVGGAFSFFTTSTTLVAPEFRLHARILIAPVAIVALLSLLTVRREFVFRDSESLWTDVLRKHPTSFLGHYQMALVHSRQGRNALAADDFAKSLQYETDHTETADTWALMANCLLRAGDKDAAFAAFQHALELRPGHFQALNGIGNIEAERGDFAAAVNAYRKAIRSAPRASAVHTNLGNALSMLGELDEAAASYRKALEINADDAMAHYHLGHVYARQKKFAEAAGEYTQALQIDPQLDGARVRLQQVLQALQQNVP